MLCSVTAFEQQCQAFAEGSTAQSPSTAGKQTLQEHTRLTKRQSLYGQTPSAFFRDTHPDPLYKKREVGRLTR